MLTSLIGSNIPAICKPLKSNENVQNRPELKQFGDVLGVFLLSRANDSLDGQKDS